MATSEDKDGQKFITAHKDAARLGPAETDAPAPEAMTAADDVPPVTADVDETPKAIRYGAAILLGMTFGVVCYLLGAHEISDRKYAPKHPVATEQYFSQSGTYGDPSIYGPLPDPFLSPFEPTLESDYLMQNNTPSVAKASAATTSTPIPQPTKVAVAETPSGTVVYLFEFDSTTVPENKELTAIAQHATTNGLCLDVRAYTDEKGRPAYNQKLSERRAKAIGEYLVAHGVPRKNISVHGMGSTHAYGDDFQDRRAEVIEISR